MHHIQQQLRQDFRLVLPISYKGTAESGHIVPVSSKGAAVSQTSSHSTALTEQQKTATSPIKLTAPSTATLTLPAIYVFRYHFAGGFIAPHKQEQEAEKQHVSSCCSASELTDVPINTYN